MSAPPDTWLDLPSVAEELSLPVTRVRQLLREGALLAVRGGDGVLRVPADFIQDGQVLKGLQATITLLHDNRFTDDEILDWLYTPEDTLPGTPVEALRQNRGTEVKRRAQAAG
jgi:hypothetical protein